MTTLQRLRGPRRCAGPLGERERPGASLWMSTGGVMGLPSPIGFVAKVKLPIGSSVSNAAKGIVAVAGNGSGKGTDGEGAEETMAPIGRSMEPTLWSGPTDPGPRRPSVKTGR